MLPTRKYLHELIDQVSDNEIQIFTNELEKFIKDFHNHLP